MNIEDAINRACADVGIIPPTVRKFGSWIHTDTLSGRNGKGDGRLIINEANVTAWNWQTGEKVTVGLKDSFTPADRKKISRQIEADKAKKKAKAIEAARIAGVLVSAAKLSSHPYLVSKGFPDEKALVIAADDVRRICGDYLVPTATCHAIIVPARVGNCVTSLQLIWESGEKKFLYGGEISGSSHRISTGRILLLCEGFATGLSIRAALRGCNVSATILCCFSASNVAEVARSIKAPCRIATDNDKPLPQYDGLGTGEHYAQLSGRPYTMPIIGETDFNDMHMASGIFAVQRHLSSFLKLSGAAR